MVGVRPEAITLSDRGEESQRCVIRHVAYMGPQYEVTVEWHGQENIIAGQRYASATDVGEYYSNHPYGMFVLADAA
ncbi:TOBE domain-containing protein [Escherichia coli]|uniref:TOBE domain-containing protein n=1 Tax=Escherichia coli TaxID=562 RepID=UPI0025A405D6|nr:TOBE domain-containing protein [Escherichia coli]